MKPINAQRLSIAIFLMSLSSAAMTPAQTSVGTSIPLVVDYARFRAEDGWDYVELYVSIPRDRLEFREMAEGHEAQYVFGYETVLGDSIVTGDSWSGVDRVDSLNHILAGQRINDQASFFLREGDYRLSVVVKDLIGGGIGSFDTALEIGQAADPGLSVSDIQLGLEISRTAEDGRFVKNGLRVVPNPQGMYTMAWPVLFYYVEIYRPEPMESAQEDAYRVQVRLLEGENVLRVLAPKAGRWSHHSVVDVGSCLVTNLASGAYTLGIEVHDEATGAAVSRKKSFYVYRPSDFLASESPAPDLRERSGPGFDAMTEGALDSLFEKFEYIAGDEEKGVYTSLSLEGKQRFLLDFWDTRDLEPATPQNEAMVEYLQRISFATGAFAWGKREGWRTDQGRVYVVYGPPDDILRFPNTASERPYQLWYYHGIDSGVEFVFVDRTGFGEMILVHSTARNEVRDDAWMEKWLR